MGPTGCSDNPVRIYHYSLHNNPEQCSSQLLRGGNLKSRVAFLGLKSKQLSSELTCSMVISCAFLGKKGDSHQPTMNRLRIRTGYEPASNWPRTGHERLRTGHEPVGYTKRLRTGLELTMNRPRTAKNRPRTGCVYEPATNRPRTDHEPATNGYEPATTLLRIRTDYEPASNWPWTGHERLRTGHEPVAYMNRLRTGLEPATYMNRPWACHSKRLSTHHPKFQPHSIVRHFTSTVDTVRK
jgi:hypothetical protein